MAQPLPAYRGSDPYVFASYAHADEDAVFAEIRWLQDQGINVWYDTTGIGPGSEWNDEIARAIKGADQFLYFITPSSIASEHCRRELSFAQSENRRVVVAHLEETELPDGLRLSLNNRQAILKGKLGGDTFRRTLLKAVGPRDVTQRATAKQRPMPPIRTRTLYAGLLVVLLATVALWWFAGDSQDPGYGKAGDTTGRGRIDRNPCPSRTISRLMSLSPNQMAPINRS